MQLAPPTLAYNLELLQHAPSRGTASDHGCCGGNGQLDLATMQFDWACG